MSPAVRVFASLSGAVPSATRRARLAEFPDQLSVAAAASALRALPATNSDDRLSAALPPENGCGASGAMLQ